MMDFSNKINDNNLFDTFRELHPSLKRYTCRRKNPLKQSRLDFFLVTENTINSVKYLKLKQATNGPFNGDINLNNE